MSSKSLPKTTEGSRIFGASGGGSPASWAARASGLVASARIVWVVLLAANARIVWMVLLTVADPVDLATSAAAARAGAAAGATPVVGATSSAGGMSAKSKSDASNDMVADVGSAFELGDVVAPTGPGADDAVAGNVEADDAPPGIVPAGDAPAVGAPVADAAT